MEPNCHCNVVIGQAEDEDEQLVPVYRWCPIHKNEDRFPFLARDIRDLKYKGIRLNKEGMKFYRELQEQKTNKEAT